MRITGIETFPLRLRPVKVGYRAEDELSKVAMVGTVIVRITTDAGISGYGEAATIRSYFNQTLGTLLDWLEAYAVALVGANPMQPSGIERLMDGVSGQHPPGCQPARASIDMAVHDIIGKARGCPVYEVLGGAYRTEFELLTNLYEESPDAKAAAASDFVAAGFRGLKVKVGDSIILHGKSVANLELEKEKLRATLAVVPEDVYVDADANQSWGSAKLAIGVVEDLLREYFHPNLSLEQPLHHLDLAGHAYVRHALPIPIILDESVVSPEAMLQIVRQEAADRVVLKVGRVGGLRNARRIADICEAASIGLSLDTMPYTKLGDTAQCHFGATLRDPYPIDAEGHLWFEDTPFEGGLEIRDGRAILGRAPGFGVELNEDKLHAMLISRPH